MPLPRRLLPMPPKNPHIPLLTLARHPKAVLQILPMTHACHLVVALQITLLTVMQQTLLMMQRHSSHRPFFAHPALHFHPPRPTRPCLKFLLLFRRQIVANNKAKPLERVPTFKPMSSSKPSIKKVNSISKHEHTKPKLPAKRASKVDHSLGAKGDVAKIIEKQAAAPKHGTALKVAGDRTTGKVDQSKRLKEDPVPVDKATEKRNLAPRSIAPNAAVHEEVKTTLRGAAADDRTFRTNQSERPREELKQTTKLVGKQTPTPRSITATKGSGDHKESHIRSAPDHTPSMPGQSRQATKQAPPPGNSMTPRGVGDRIQIKTCTTPDRTAPIVLQSKTINDDSVLAAKATKVETFTETGEVPGNSTGVKAHRGPMGENKFPVVNKPEQSSQLRPQSDLHFSATEVKRARICSTKSLTEQNLIPVYSDYDNVPSMVAHEHQEEHVLKTKRSASLGPQMGVSATETKPLSLPREKQRSQTIAGHRLVCDAYTQTFPPKVVARRKLSQTRKSRSLDVYYDTREEESCEKSNNLTIGNSAPIYASNSLTAVHKANAKRQNFAKSVNKSESNISTSKPNAKKPQPPVKPALLKNFKSFTRMRDFKIHPQDGRNKQAKKPNLGLITGGLDGSFSSTGSGQELNFSGMGEMAAISVLSLTTSDDWNDALSDRTEDLTFPKEVQKYRGLIRGSSLSYRSRLTSCGGRDVAYESDEFEYDYNFDRKEAYSRVNASLQPDDEFEDVRYTTVVTSESSNNAGEYHQTHTRLGEAENNKNQINLMDENRGDFVAKKPLKPAKYIVGEPGEKRRREEQTNFARLVLLHNNQTKNSVASQGGIINYALTTPTHSRASSYDNNNNNNSTDAVEEKSETTGEHRPSATLPHPLTRSSNVASAPTLSSPMSDGMPDFGAIVDTVTAVRSKTSPRGSTSGVSSSSSSKSSTLARHPEPVDGGFNENDEWAQIANVMKSVGSSLNKGQVYAQEFEETFWRIMTGSDLPRYVGTWLSDLNLSQYEEVLCGNGFDNINFLASDILEEQDLVDMNILNATHQRRMLDSAKNLPKIRTLASFAKNDNVADARTAPTSVSEWLQSLALGELEQTFKMMGIMTLERVKTMKDTEIAALVNLRGHRKRIRASIGYPNSHPTKTARSMSQPSTRSPGAKLKSSPPLPRSPLLDKVNFFKDYSKTTHSSTVKTNSSVPSSNSYGTTSSSSSAFTNYSSLSDQVVPVAISEEPSADSSDRRSRKSGSTTRYHRNQSSSSTTESHHRRQSEQNSNKPKTQDFSQINIGDNFQPQEEDLLTLAISKLTETSSKKSNGKHEDKENIGMTTTATTESEVRVPDARRASYLSSTGGELVLRPPNETTEEVSVSSWCHDPEVLIKSCCNYQAYYLGSMLVHEVKGVESTVEACSKMKKSTDSMKKIPTVTLSISYRGVKFIDSKTKHEIAEHEIHNISFASQDADDLSTLAYITRDARTGNHYCHVFRVTTLDVAYEIILTLGQAFEVAYQLILKERALQDGTV